MVFSQFVATVMIVEPRFDPSRIDEIHRRLTATPELGRSAVLLAELSTLAATSSDAAARLVADLVLGRFEGVPRETLNTVIRAVPVSVCAKAYALTRSGRSFSTSLLFARFTTKEVRPYLESVRDGSPDSNDYMFTEGLVRTAFELAVGRIRESSESLYRKDGAETLFLFGATNAPDLLLREMHIISYYPRPSSVYDLDVARWSLSNPHHTKKSRAYVVSLCASPVLAELSNEGAVSVCDVAGWVAPRTHTPFDPQIMVALTDRTTPSMKSLRSRLFALVGDLFTYVAVLDPTQRALVLNEQFGPQPASVLEYVDQLISRWTRTLPELLSTAQRLDRASRSAASHRG